MDNYVARYHRVYLVDDHQIVRRGLRDLLADANDIHVVGDCGSAQEAVPEILRLEVDVMLLDLQLQDGTGIEVCRAVRAIKPSVCGVLLTASGDDEALAAAVLAGAAGYLVKLSGSNQIASAIRNQKPGRPQLDAGSVERASRLLGETAEALTPHVTEHEPLVLQHVIGGQTDPQIVEVLGNDSVDLGADIARLIARMTQALLGGGHPPGEPGTGRHRRPD